MRSLAIFVSAFVAMGGATTSADDHLFLDWTTVVNDGVLIPGSDLTFCDYEQPSLNDEGFVVFRANGAGQGVPFRGVFSCDMPTPDGAVILCRVDTSFEVPPPNNRGAHFDEFPSFPRVDIDSNTMATLGVSPSVWAFRLPDGSETRAGTDGIYLAVPTSAVPTGFVTGVAQLGGVRDPLTGGLVFPRFQVTGAPKGTGFASFRGAPSVTDHGVLVFQGTFTDPDTFETGSGIYFRDAVADQGQARVELIADTGTPIPDQASDVRFGAFAPPSAARGTTVFVGFDEARAPSIGGIYLASVLASVESLPTLRTLVALGDPVPGVPEPTGRTFSRIGADLSYDGRFVGFWGAWGNEIRPVALACPEDGDPGLIAYCNGLHPDGFVAREFVHQGVFVHDTFTGRTFPIATTDDGFAGFRTWRFSGLVPTLGPADADEFAQWRPASFVAVHGAGDGSFRVAFKAALADSGFGENVEAVDGIFLSGGPNFRTPLTVARTGMAAALLDGDAPAEAVVVALGLEREGFRNGRVVIAARMRDDARRATLARPQSIGTGQGDDTTLATWAGLYLADATHVSWCAGDVVGDAIVDAVDLDALLARWGKADPGATADLDGDGDVGMADVLLLLGAWGNCP